ncbi:hypothetical protein ANN_15399 [Periplaneta americana]|uniref:Uncharacterized protein n=1 Tax=Periplaneta americana TaxID=6978 RepID=A0ABQ8SHE6_PERAM|nr:hypothetical protein ANN_15399 [Periplaneta americana]
MRLNANRWTHILTTWDPRIGKRNAGRQKTRWADEIRARFSHLWSRTAKDRQQWKLITNCLFNDAVSTTRLFSVDEIGESEMVFGEMRPRIRHRLPGIYVKVGENIGKNPTSSTEMAIKSSFKSEMCDILHEISRGKPWTHLLNNRDIIAESPWNKSVKECRITRHNFLTDYLYHFIIIACLNYIQWNMDVLMNWDILIVCMTLQSHQDSAQLPDKRALLESKSLSTLKMDKHLPADGKVSVQVCETAIETLLCPGRKEEQVLVEGKVATRMSRLAFRLLDWNFRLFRGLKPVNKRVHSF